MNTQPEDRRGRTLPSLVAVGVFAGCALLLVHYAAKATLFPNMMDGVVAREWDLFALILFITSAAAAGAEILARAKLDLGTPASRLVYSLALGFLCFYVAGTLLAIAQAVSITALWCVPVGTLVLCRRQVPALRDDLMAAIPRKLTLSPVTILAVLMGLTYAYMSIGPPYDIDAMAYHLALPADYLAHGGVTRAPDNFYKNFPSAMSMLYLFLMGMGSDFLPKMLHGLFLLLLVVLCFDRMQAIANRTVAAYAALFFAAQWSVHHAIERVAVDMHFALYALLGFFLLLEVALAAPAQAANDRARVVLAGVLIGGAIASKLNAISSLVASDLVLAGLVLSKRVAWRTLIYFHVAAFAVYFPTLLRNCIYSVEPLFVPFADFLGRFLPIDPDEVERYRAAAEIKPLLMTQLSPITFLLTPLFTYVNGRFPNPTFDGFIDPLYLVLLPVGAWLAIRNVMLRWILVYLFGYYCVWLATATVIRYAFPALPLLAFVTVYSLWALAENGAGRGRVLLELSARGIILSFVLISTADFVLRRGSQLALNGPAFLGAVDRLSYMRSVHADEVSIVEVGAFLHARDEKMQRTPARDGVFMVFESQNFHLGRHFYNDPAFINLRLLEDHQRRGEDPVERLSRLGYRYVLTDFNRVPWLRNSSNHNPYISPYPEGLRRLDDMLRYWSETLRPRLTPLGKFGSKELFEVASPTVPGA